MCNNIVGGKNMSHLLLIILGFSIIFIATTLGAATIYLFKNNISIKLIIISNPNMINLSILYNIFIKFICLTCIYINIIRGITF